LPNVTFLFVDDGSRDSTRDVLVAHVASEGGDLLRLEKNVGKAEAVRLGLIEALNGKPFAVGYLDADGAFPADEVARLVDVFWRAVPIDTNAQVTALWSSRVKLAGHDIQRKASRHYLARILLTGLAVRHHFDVYDTQSGFKIFGASPELRQCLDRPFRTRWFVDLELYLRWREVTHTDMGIWEEPVRGWYDVEGSKLSGSQFWAVLADVAQLMRRST
jgi:glycosyltransferase involved in cell wall biosynthesis